MAGTITHGYFSIDVYNRLDDNIKDNLKNNKETFKTCNLGHDIYYYSHNFYNKSQKNIGNYMHKHDTKNFFINTIKYIKDNHLENNYEIIAYLYGYIGHYALDSTTHPYITYKTGYFNKRKKETYKYNSKHGELESYIDTYFINKNENIKPYKFKIHNFCFNTEISKELEELINYTLYKTYKFNNMGKCFKSGIRNMKTSYRIFRYDPLKIKVNIYKFIDFFLPKKVRKLSCNMYSYDLNNNDYYLNLKHKKWCHPRYKNEVSTESFIDLYNDSIDKAVYLINEVNKVLYKSKDISYLDKIFLNTSMTSGKDCNDKAKNKYFEF